MGLVEDGLLACCLMRYVRGIGIRRGGVICTVGEYDEECQTD